eukprot:jgi/Astpho2/1697/fgenesh1_pg.00032_%23_37_t
MQRSSVTLDCPRARVGRVIGKGGETIKALQQYTGAMIQIDQSVEPTRVTIAGSAQSLQLALCMVRDIVAGNFKGFAMLRQLTSTQNNPYEALAQPQPVYVEGYGFVPPSQADVLRNQTPGGLAAPGLGSVAQVPSGFLQSQLPAQAFNNGLGLGGLLNTIHGMNSTNMTVAEGAQALALKSASDSSSRLGSLSTESTTSSPGCFAGLSLGSQQGQAARQQLSVGQQGLANLSSLPGGWLQMADPEGRSFWLNAQTGQAQWAPPVSF